MSNETPFSVSVLCVSFRARKNTKRETALPSPGHNAAFMKAINRSCQLFLIPEVIILGPRFTDIKGDFKAELSNEIVKGKIKLELLILL